MGVEVEVEMLILLEVLVMVKPEDQAEVGHILHILAEPEQLDKVMLEVADQDLDQVVAAQGL